MTKEPRVYSVERIVSSIKNVGKLDGHMQKKKVKLDHYHTHKMTEWVKDSPGNRGLTRRQMHEHL